MSDNRTQRAPVEGDVIVWTKPNCQQCRMVKRRLDDAGVTYVEADLTPPEHAADLEWFIGIGYRSAPVTEFGGLAIPGFVPAEIDQLIAAWWATHPASVTASTDGAA